uniref:Galactosylceramide sulfotransferase-like n=1 Tax=Saccoglossus kowalevskii TaxID=10224 RepID=A0ABM0GTY3_SACKO|nr:PREDICTED: galactosylceramide sulfotransferase-like [Saccoglossus kowalevskii]
MSRWIELVNRKQSLVYATVNAMEQEYNETVRASIMSDYNWKSFALRKLPHFDNQRAMTLLSTITVFYIWYQVLAFENYYDKHFQNNMQPISWKHLGSVIKNRTLLSNDEYNTTVNTTLIDTEMSEFIKSEVENNDEDQPHISQMQDITGNSEATREKTCRKTKNVMFLKTHKTGSDTISEIIMRFGDLNNLSMALPRFSDYDLAYPNLPRQMMFLKPTQNAYNLFFLHTIYNKTFFDFIMAPESQYVTIIREPFMQFQSAFSFFKIADALNLTNTSAPLHTFLKHHDTVWSKREPQFLKNFMSFDLGLPTADENNVTAAWRFIQKLDFDYKLVMIMEYFDESVVLMKRLLCWDLKDILYIPINAGWRVKAVTRAGDRDLYKKFSPVDHRLYEHFNSTFWKKVSSEINFSEEVSYFRDINAKFLQFCKQVSSNETVTLTIPSSYWSGSFIIDSGFCSKSRIFLPDYVHMLKSKLYDTGDAISNPKLWNIV